MAIRLPSLLVLDPEPEARVLVAALGREAGFDVLERPDSEGALAAARTQLVDLAIVDVGARRSGIVDVPKAIAEASPGVELIFVGQRRLVDAAAVAEAITLGARDCLDKPLDLTRLKRLLVEIRLETEQRRRLPSPAEAVGDFHGLIGRGPAMRALFARVSTIAPRLRTALIRGETGAGKSAVAAALHRLGPRAGVPFVIVTASTDGEALFGAAEDPPAGGSSLLEIAADGTVLLDQVGDLTMAQQARLLRVLETRELSHISGRPVRVDPHVLATTSTNLRAAISAGQFRRELFHEISVVDLEVPPLRARRDDIEPLAWLFFRQAAQALRKPLMGLAPDALARLRAAAWPGNVRELRNTVHRACLLADGDWVTERDLQLPEP